MNTLSTRDRRALLLLGLALIAILIWRFGFDDAGQAAPTAALSSAPLPMLEKRLQSLRQRAALNPAKQEVRDRLAAATEEREKILLRADTPQQAQAALLAKVRDILESQEPSLRAAQTDLGAILPHGEDYGEVAVTVGFPCTIEQLVNVMADIAALNEAVATKALNVAVANRQKKTLNVRLTVSALTPRSLVPEQVGANLR